MLAVILPSTVLVAVILAVPVPVAVTRPVSLTVATALSSLSQVTALLVPAGNAVTLNCCVPPVVSVTLFGKINKDSNLGGSGGSGVTVPDVTVTVMLALILPSTVLVAVILAVPAPIAVTKPALLTVATAPLLLFQVTALLVPAGNAVTVSCRVPPVVRERLLGEITNDSNLGGCGGTGFVTVTVMLALTLLSTVLVAVILAVPADLAVTTPSETVATCLLSEVQSTLLLAPLGVAVTVISGETCPTSRFRELTDRVNAVGLSSGTGGRLPLR